MKKLHLFLVIVIAALSLNTNAQTKQAAKKETVKVYGNCEMCQSKIEKAAKAAGATTASWDVDSKILSVSYNPGKATIAKIEKAVAAAGYDTEHEVTTTEAFDKLPGCCQYERKGAASAEGTEKKDKQ